MRSPCPLLLLALSMTALPAAAQTAIHRCIGSTGNPVFTDQSCASMQASPVRRPPGPDDTAKSLPPMLCAATRDDLRQGVIEAFAQRDANQLAGLMLWGGYGHRAAVADIHALASLVRRPLLDIDFPGCPPATDSGANAGIGVPQPLPVSTPAQLVLHTADQLHGGFPRELRFDTVRRAGCLWLRNPD